VPTGKPPGYWKDITNQKEFFDQLATKWNIQNLDDWNNVTREMAKKEGGSFIDTYYNGSLKQGTNPSKERNKFILLVILVYWLKEMTFKSRQYMRLYWRSMLLL
jgi:hypothetical protein